MTILMCDNRCEPSASVCSWYPCSLPPSDAAHGCVLLEQTPGTERILYGLDDVKNAAEIIIVEGEMDKLALEEAGMRNVISVPDGAPRAVKEGELPPENISRRPQVGGC